MKATELLRDQMELSKSMTASLLADMQDAPLTAPTSQGGNHPLWIAGHLVYSEARLTNELLFDKPGPLLEWSDMFSRGTQPSYEAGAYSVSIPEILAKWDEVRANTLSILAGLNEEDLDKPTAKCPPGREAVFGTYGKAMAMVAMHPLHHRGQVADARRSLGRKPLMS
jgi:hypothetical protein